MVSSAGVPGGRVPGVRARLGALRGMNTWSGSTDQVGLLPASSRPCLCLCPARSLSAARRDVAPSPAVITASLVYLRVLSVSVLCILRSCFRALYRFGVDIFPANADRFFLNGETSLFVSEVKTLANVSRV